MTPQRRLEGETASMSFIRRCIILIDNMPLVDCCRVLARQAAGCQSGGGFLNFTVAHAATLFSQRTDLGYL